MDLYLWFDFEYQQVIFNMLSCGYCYVMMF